MQGLVLRAVTLVACTGAALALAGVALAGPPRTVCGSGCAFTSVQAAIDAAVPGATITIGPGKYVENVTVTKPVTLRGAGNSTVIYPAVSAPNPCTGSSLCGGAASTIILVQANDVTISNLRLEGDNPALTSGVVAGGADIDARNGIITDHSTGTWNNLTVSQVTLSDIYLRGIYASSGGTFTFLDNSVSNIQADPASIAIFNFGGSGLVSGNRVDSASDAIAANWSTGTQFLNNVVTHSASGIHTDNSSGGDVIKGNTVRSCTSDGWGIFVFAPYTTATVEANVVRGCAVGIAAFGTAAAGQGPLIKGNDLQGAGAATGDPTGTVGIYITTDLIGWGFSDVNATVTGNSIRDFATGLLVTQTRALAGGTPSGQATVTAAGNSIVGNVTGANGETGTVVGAAGNWWGCAAGPNRKSCDTAVGTTQFTPWLTRRPSVAEHDSSDDGDGRPGSAGGGGHRGERSDAENSDR